MNAEELRDLFGLDHELSGVEFKGPGLRSDRAFIALVARAALGMTNRRDGGLIVIGVGEDRSGRPVPQGLSSDERASWDYDSVADALDSYANPNVVFEMQHINVDGKDFVVIEVEEFDDIPVLCNRSYDDTLRKGACYVRPRRKPETTEIATQEDMRDLLDLATDKRLRRFIRQATSVGLLIAPFTVPDDSSRFDYQIDDFLGN